MLSCFIHVWFYCDPMDCSRLGSSVHGILQARILECVAIPFSRGSSWPRDQTCVSYVSWLAGGFFTTSATWEALVSFKNFQNPFAKIKRFGRGRCRLFQVWFARIQVPCCPLRKDGWVRTSFQWLECVHGGEVWSSPLESEMGAMGWGDRATQQEGPSSQYCSLLSMWKRWTLSALQPLLCLAFCFPSKLSSILTNNCDKLGSVK